jgi:hypothetical protein
MRWIENFVIVLLTLGVAACASAVDQGSCITEQGALSSANEFIKQRMPDELQPNYPRPVLTDNGNEWQVAYGLPEGTTGGAPTIFIDKKTCKVVKAISGQ